MRTTFIPLIFVLAIFSFLPVFVIATDNITLSGHTLLSNGTEINGTNVTIEVYEMGGTGPTLVAGKSNWTSSNATGYFSVIAEGNTSYMYKPVLIKYNESNSDNADYMGQSLPMFPYQEMSQLSSGINFYLKEAATLFINATKDNSAVNFSYSVKDTKLGYGVKEEYTTQVDNVTVYVPADRNYSIQVYPFQSMPAAYELNNISDYGDSPHIDIPLNTTEVNKWVTGYVNPDAVDTIDDAVLITFLLEAGDVVARDHPMPYNMSHWRGPTVADSYNATSGFYNVTIPGSAMGSDLILFAVANNISGYYGSFKNLTLNADSGDAEVNFTTIYELAGNSHYITLDLANGGEINITLPLKTFNITNDTGSAPSNAFIQLGVNYEDFDDGPEFTWLISLSDDDDGIFKVPMFVTQTDDVGISIFTQDYAPKKDSLGEGDLGDSTDIVDMELDNFNPRGIGSGEQAGDSFTDLTITMYKSTTACNVPYPDDDCILADSEDIDTFSPFGIVIGGGDISMRMTKTDENIVVQYNHVDLLASGPPDAMFDDTGSETTSGTTIDMAWRFGSKGPEIYDNILIGIPYDPTDYDEDEDFVMLIPKIYDNTWSEIWDRDDDPVAQLTGTDYEDFNAGEYADYLDTGITCSKTNATAICFVNTTDNMVWMKIPHFSGVGSSLSGTSPTTSTNGGDGGGTTDSNRTTKTWGTLSSGTTQTMNIYKKNIGIRKIQLKVKSNIQNAKLVITNFGTTKPTDVSEPSGGIYKYIKMVHTNIEDDNIEEAFIEFQITKSWLEDNSIDKDDIRLLRYTNQWDVLDTEITDELTEYVRYKAPTPGFSYFLIGTAEAGETTTTTVTTTTIGTTTTTTGGIIPSEINKKYVYIGILAAVIIIFLVLIFSTKGVSKDINKP